MAIAEDAIEATIGSEGAYGNDANDSGGPTNWGITQDDLVASGHTGGIVELTKQDAINIYKRLYWEPMCLDFLENQAIANQIFQAAVNQGIILWAVYMQEACNLNMPIEARLTCDAVIGTKTLSAVNNITSTQEGIKALSKSLYELQQTRYDRIVAGDPKQESFRDGWHNRAIKFFITEVNP